MKKLKVIWLECCGCSGNIISFLNSNSPSFKVLVNDYIDLVYNNSHMFAYGSAALDIFYNTISKDDYILIVEGSIATKNNGVFNIIGKYNDSYITGLQAVIDASKRALNIIAVGTCACFGGISSSSPNVSECKPLSEIVEKKIIKMPGCPCSGDWIASLILELSLNHDVKLDSLNRPIFLYGTTIHDLCERRIFFEKKIFAKHLGDLSCMFNLGCKGPYTKAPCPYTRWNGYLNWPVRANTPCIGCANPKFPYDKLIVEDKKNV